MLRHPILGSDKDWMPIIHLLCECAFMDFFAALCKKIRGREHMSNIVATLATIQFHVGSLESNHSEFFLAQTKVT